MNIVSLKQFAYYNCNAYGAGAYNAETCSTAQTTNNPPTGGQLTGTGEALWLPLVIGFVLLATSVAVLIGLRRRKNKA